MYCMHIVRYHFCSIHQQLHHNTMVYLGLRGNGLVAGITAASGMGFILFGGLAMTCSSRCRYDGC